MKTTVSRRSSKSVAIPLPSVPAAVLSNRGAQDARRSTRRADRNSNAAQCNGVVGQAGLPDLAIIIQKYNEVTDRLKRSHDALAQEVCRLRDELHRKNKELEHRERLAALGQMAAGVAHEVRNPLGGIRLYASMLERDLADRPKERALVRRLESGVRNLDSIVGGILAFAGNAEPRPRAVHLGPILDGVITQAEPRARERNVSLDVGPALAGVEVYCDATQIERALLNIVLNAIDAVEEHGHVWVRSPRTDDPRCCDDSMCYVCIEDDGPGIEPDLLFRLFHPFFTTKETGTGLGLAIVHRIAEANGGGVIAGNRPEGGAVFVLSVPRSCGDG
jgi:signal transduction histidine kinase